MGKEYLKLKSVESRQGLALPVISPCGKYVYVVYADSKQNVAELFENKCGNLKSLEKLLGDSNFVAETGYANSKFSKFSLVDCKIGQTIFNDARLRIFDKNFNLVKERIFENTFNAIGGNFSSDGKYILFTYITQLLPQTSNVLILCAKTLKTVASTLSATHSNGAYFFKHGHKTFISIASGNSSKNPQVDFFAPPADLTVYRLKHDKLILIDKKPLPQFPIVTGILNKQKTQNCSEYSTLIGVGTRAAFLKNENGLSVDNEGFESFLPKNGDEIVIYNFDGCKLKLQISQNPNMSIIPMSFNQKLNMVAIGYVNQQICESGYLALYSLCNKDLKLLQSDISVPIFPVQANFSDNGKWFILGGLNDPNVQIPIYNNVLLYKVSNC